MTGGLEAESRGSEVDGCKHENTDSWARRGEQSSGSGDSGITEPGRSEAEGKSVREGKTWLKSPLGAVRPQAPPFWQLGTASARLVKG